ncbi:cupin domain-containing protein [Nonomuraea phyllanthi]|uniref:Cupin domain-containing protein n=1 Tax=Nonomuraea phyllanthi TaxID=2219224 RepID=A0A5C4VN33_9ACTN|nr:cupin domain-containing protein [Nonomuraea phyllanthi]KAB8189616.1 cupin domain-containing protein [Nonomuraea phyllanthi]QFY12031.1 cupin domain-containing protein [Nonomuraea phyllanthi]
MSTDHAHAHQLDNPDKSGPPPKIDVVATVAGAPPAPEGAEAMTILVTLPPNSPGAPPHRHSGPAYGYVVKGAINFELEGDPVRVVRAGEAFWEPGGDVIHYQDGNHLSDEESVFVVTMFCAPGQPMLIPVSPEELEARRDRRAPQS